MTAVAEETTTKDKKPAKDKTKGGKPFDLSTIMENRDGTPNQAEKNTLGDALAIATSDVYQGENLDKEQRKRRGRLWRKILKYNRRALGHRVIHLDDKDRVECLTCVEKGLNNFLWVQVYELFEECSLEPDDDEE